MNMAIEVSNVSKRFGEVKALDDVSVSFGGEQIYGLLGNNGAGKSTLLNIIAGRLFADQGAVSVDGLPGRSDAALCRIHLMGEKNLFPEEMKVRQALRWAGELYRGFDREYALSLAEQFKLRTDKKITALSTGYASIFRFVTALATNAPYLLLDEPVLGLDAQHRDLLYRLLLTHYAERPCTIVISTHLIAEVANLLAHTVFIREGKIIVDAPRDSLADGALREAMPAVLSQSGFDLQNYFIRLMKGGEGDE